MRRKLSNTAKVRYLSINYASVMRSLKSYARRVARRGNVKLILLFGSLAEGTYTGTSDADLLIVAEDLPKNPFERYQEFATIDLKIDVEPRIYTEREFMVMVKHQEGVILRALKVGIPLYSKQHYLESIREKAHFI